MPSVYAMIRAAVINRQVVTATYNNHRRMMCPHVLGVKNGRRQALFYQFAGSSSTVIGPPGSPSSWRCIPIDELVNVVVTDGDWHSAANHSRRQTCVDVIDVEVDY